MNSRTLIVALAAVFSTVAVAQQPGRPDGPPPPGFQGRQGGPGMPRGQMGPPMGPGLLLRPEVVKELKLTEEQIEDIEDLAPRQPMGMRRGQGGPPGQPGQHGQPGGPPPPPQGHPGRQGGQMGQPPMGRPGMGGPPMGGAPGRMMNHDRELRKILSSTQYKRFQEIELQVHGAPALGRPDIAAKVGLSDDQVDAIHDILDENMGPRGERGLPGGGPPPTPRGDRPGEPGRRGDGDDVRERRGDRPGNPDQMREEHKARRAAVDKKILALLSADQVKAWKGLLGNAFELAEPKAPRDRDDRDGR